MKETTAATWLERRLARGHADVSRPLSRQCGPACRGITATYGGVMDSAAMRSPDTWRAALSIAALVVTADQVSKSLVLAAAPGDRMGGLVSVRLVRNTGASFGIGAGHPVLITLVAGAAFAIAAGLLFATRRRGVALFLAAVLGGAAGNLADRMFRSPGSGRGAVVDWIHLAGYPATFNVADIAIRLGAVGAVIVALRAAPRIGRWSATGRDQFLRSGIRARTPRGS